MKIVYTIIALLTCSASFAQSGRYILDLGIPQSYEPTKAVVKDYGTHQLAGGMYHNGQNALYFWLAKLNSDTVVWSKSISASPYWYPMDINPTEIVECNNGDIIFIGRGIAFAGQYSAKVIKTDASGNLLWQKEFFAQNQYSQGVYENNPAILENDGIILSMSGDNDLYEAKIDFSGNLVSSHQLKLDVTSSGITPGYLFIPNHSGGYFAGFECDSSVAVVSLDASMNVLWAKKMLIGENARLRSIYQTTAGSILIGGLTGMQGETFIGELNPNGTVQSYHQLSNSELYSIDQLFEINDSTLLANTRTGYLKINKNDWSYDETTFSGSLFNSFRKSANGWTFGSAWSMEYFLDFNLDSPECIQHEFEANKLAESIPLTSESITCNVNAYGAVTTGTIWPPEDMMITTTNNCYLSVSDETINDLTVYPNPVQSGSTLSFSHEIKNAVIVFIDLQGKTVAETTFAQQVSVPRLNAGIYLVKIIDKKGTVATQRIVVE